MILSCPVAAEMILFAREPLKFEFVEVPEKIHSHGGKIGYSDKLDHSDCLKEKFFVYLEEHTDFFELMDTLLEGEENLR